MLELILGGARSGKSGLAAQRAAASGRSDVLFVATAQPRDAEMRERIERHRRDRPASWLTREAPVHLVPVLRAAPRESFVVVDCLTLWISNVLYPARGNEIEADEAGWARERNALLEVLHELACDCVLVSNEVGLGLVPETPVGRRFRDEQGRLNQQIAAICDRVTFVAAGLPLTLKSTR